MIDTVPKNQRNLQKGAVLSTIVRRKNKATLSSSGRCGILTAPVQSVLILILLLATSACAGAEDYTDDPIRTLLPFDAIPAITDPQFVPANAAKLDPDAPVIGVTFNGESHAYSLYLLNGHEIVNDVVGGLNIATTW